MAVVRTKALILRHLPEREYDRVLTPDHGQLRVRAKAVTPSVEGVAQTAAIKFDGQTVMIGLTRT